MTIFALAQFINWHEVTELGKSKPRKVPFDPQNGHPIDPHNPLNWKTHAEAVATGAPVGFVFTTADPFFFLDLDDCYINGAWTDEATAFFNTFNGAAREISVSGRGLHIVGRCDQLVLSDRRNKFGTASRANWLEFYTTKRFMALGRGFVGDFNQDFTQQLLALVPQRPVVDPATMLSGPVPEYTGPQDDAELIRKMTASRGSIGAQFGTKASAKDLWHGDAANLSQIFPSPSNDVYDRSSADAALMAHLAFWTGKDSARMDRLFRQSALMRPKYAERPAYRESTIKNAVSQCQHVYNVAHNSEEQTVSSEKLNEDVLADIFSRANLDKYRYVEAWHTWLIWDRYRWRKEGTGKAYDVIRTLCRAAARAPELNENRANKIASAATVSAVEKLARADRRHAATGDDWDGDPWLLNTPTCVVDLKTGEIRGHDPLDYMMKSTAVGPSRDATCPLWRSFLDRTFNGDIELISFVQRVAGYCLTGMVREHALFFAYGKGGNGKGVFINTLTRLMADYSVVAPMETFTASQYDRHPTDLAMLQGARFVSSQETEEGRKWNESRLKQLTGGDRVTARFMRGDYFSYDPQFKLLIAGNHKPALRSVDEAIRRRFHLIPFTAEIRAADRDPNLEEKLRAEWPAILRWAIEGCLQWQRIGLAPPGAVKDATEDYFSSEDVFAQWIEECCIRNPQKWESSTTLYSNFKSWAEKSGEYAFTQKRFSQSLIDRGFLKQNNRTGKGFIGLELHLAFMPGMSRMPPIPLPGTDVTGNSK